jgi:hypothetical protein
VTTQTGPAIPHFNVCLLPCDLRDPNACGGSTVAGIGACLVDGKGSTDCEGIEGVRTDGEACSPTDDCGPGLVCVNTTSAGVTLSRCKRWCQVGSKDCGGNKTCSGFQDKLMVAGTEYGACP